MTTELVLLLLLSGFIVLGVFVNKETGPRATFENASPSLGARIERQLETGSGFQKTTLNYSNFPGGNGTISWSKAGGDTGAIIK